MEKNIKTYEKIAEIVTEIVNPHNYRKSQLEFDRLSQNDNPIFKFTCSKIKSSAPNAKNEIASNNEKIITKLPFIEELISFLQNKIHDLSPKQNCKAEYCECKYEYNKYRLFQIMWELISYVYYPEDIDMKSELNGAHLKKIIQFDLSYNNIPQFIHILIQEIREIFNRIYNEFPESTLLEKDGLERCLSESIHEIELQNVIWESDSLIQVKEHIDQNALRQFVGLDQKKYEFPKYRIEKVRCGKCWTDFYRLTQGIILRTESTWDKLYIAFSQDKLINYNSINNKLWDEAWEALKELFEQHGLTENQAEVVAKIKLGIPLKKSTLRNTKRQLKNKLENLIKMFDIWDDLVNIE